MKWSVLLPCLFKPNIVENMILLFKVRETAVHNPYSDRANFRSSILSYMLFLCYILSIYKQFISLLLHWNQVGMDVVAELNKAIKRQGLDMKVTALVRFI